MLRALVLLCVLVPVSVSAQSGRFTLIRIALSAPAADTISPRFVTALKASIHRSQQHRTTEADAAYTVHITTAASCGTVMSVAVTHQSGMLVRHTVLSVPAGTEDVTSMADGFWLMLRKTLNEGNSR